MLLMGWTDWSTLDLYAQNLKVERTGVLAHGGSGHEQAQAQLCCVEGDEVPVAFGPPA